jgi:predicted RNase H-like HicB family nuclease
MRYQVVLIPSEEGFAVICPALPGRWSQGETEPEALTNIADAIRGYLDVRRELELAIPPVVSADTAVRAGIVSESKRRQAGWN